MVSRNFRTASKTKRSFLQSFATSRQNCVACACHLELRTMASSKSSSFTVEELHSLDLYAIVDVAEDADRPALLKAYRKKAVRVHPDKNPDNPNAAKEFIQLSKAFELLSDIKARAAYDSVRHARRAAIERNLRLDSTRRKMKADLEMRESAATAGVKIEQPLSAEAKLAAEIERLRREGNQILKREQEELQRRFATRNENFIKSAEEAARKRKHDVLPTLKVTWPSEVSLDGDELRCWFGKYGPLGQIVVTKATGQDSGKPSAKRPTALVEFLHLHDARKAVGAEAKQQLFTVRFVNEGEFSMATPSAAEKEVPPISPDKVVNISQKPHAEKTSEKQPMNFRDFEAMVLDKMKRKT